MNLQATVSYAPRHWNKVCACTIPASATAEVVLDEAGECGGGNYSLSRLYAAVLPGEADSDAPEAMRKLAVARLVEQLKERGLHGRLRVIHA